jgi:hypothetical protein
MFHGAFCKTGGNLKDYGIFLEVFYIMYYPVGNRQIAKAIFLQWSKIFTARLSKRQVLGLYIIFCSFSHPKLLVQAVKVCFINKSERAGNGPLIFYG